MFYLSQIIDRTRDNIFLIKKTTIMINTNKRWLLTASPWMKHGLRLSPLGIGGIFLWVLLVFGSQISNAQLPGVFSWGGTTGGPALAPITGFTTICPTTTTVLTNPASGGVWTSANTSIATVATLGANTATVTGVAGGLVNITYTVGGSFIITQVTVTSAIMGLTTVCTGNSIFLTDTTYTGNWSSSAPTVTIYPTGEVRGVSAGTATISYGRTGACAVTQVITVNNNTIANINGTTGPLGVCLSVPVTLSDATGPAGTWASSNNAIATIGSATGLLTGVKAGAATITYSVGGCYITNTLNVTAVSSINSIGGASSVCIGNSTVLTNTTPGGTWNSTNPSVATVVGSGIVRGLTAGTATISYNVGGCAVTKVITVNSSINSITGGVSGTANVCIGGTIALSDATPGGVWSSSVTGIAIVTGGVVTGVTTGSALISYATSAGCYATLIVQVNPATSVAAITGTSAVCLGSTTNLTDAIRGGVWSASNTTVSVSNVGLVKGLVVGTATITYTNLGCSSLNTVTVNALPTAILGTLAECQNGGTTTLSDASAGGTWTSSNTAVATIGAGTGLVTGGVTGTAIITYTNGNSCYVTATNTVVGPVAITGGNSVCIAPVTYLYLYNPERGAWTSSATTIATVAATSGVVTGVQYGTATITFTGTYTGGLKCLVTNTVTVNYAPGTISGPFATCTGAVTTLLDTAASGAWTSSNTSVATINPVTGVMTSGATAGAVVITYTKNGCYKTTYITVSAPPAAITGPNRVCTKYATITLSDATPGGIWTASNQNVYVDTTIPGMIAGASAGTATISYTIGGCSATYTVTVFAGTVKSMTGVPSVCTGLTTLLTSGVAGIGTGVWSSGNTAVAILPGSVTDTFATVLGVTAGTSVMTFTRTDGCWATMIISVHTQPTAVIGAYSVCNFSSATLSDATAGGYWSSGDQTIATVTSSGVVTGVSPGNVTITYAMPGGCMTYQPIKVNPMPLSIGGASAACTNVANFAKIVAVYDSLPGGIWTSSNTNISVSSSGSVSANVTGVAAGTATITYNVNGCFVTKAITSGSVVPNINTSAKSVCANGTASTYIIGDAASGAWASSDKTVGSVSPTSGVYTQITGILPGTVTITYTLNGCIQTQVQTINANSTPAIIGPASICLTSAPTLSDAAGPGIWTSSATTVATIGSASGLVAPVALGSTVITYRIDSGGCREFLSINVGTGPVAIAGPSSVCVGFTITLSDAVAGGAWTSSDYTIANVNASGVVTGVAAGTATLSYTLSGCTSTQIVTVNAIPASITGTMTACIGAVNTTLSDVTAGGTWTSASTIIATIDPSFGTVTGQSNGTVNISYTITATGCYKTASFKVGVAPAITGTLAVCASGTSSTLSDVFTGGAWSSSNTSVSIIGSTGVVTGAVAGTSTVTYTLAAGCYSTAVVSIGAVPATIAGTTTICSGGGTTTLSDATLGGAWASSTATVATISSGVVTGFAAGTSTISYTITGCPPATAVMNVVYTAPITGSSFTPCKHDSTMLYSATNGGTWSSSNTAVAAFGTIQAGRVYGIDTIGGGNAIISYTANGCTVTQAVVVSYCGYKGSNQPGTGKVLGNQVYSLFPNPGNGNITITQSVAEDGAMQVTVLNYTGAKVYSGSIEFAAGKAHLDLPSVTGMYLVLLQDKKGEIRTFKVMIEN